MKQVQTFASKIIGNVEKVIVGKRNPLILALVGWLAEGHLLLEDVPGVAKTMLARSLARSLGAAFKRIQCTPDLLPTDVTGASIFNQKSGDFEFRPGPVFCNLLLADEINRTTPRTQAALLEAMGEGKVTVDGVTRTLAAPFLVIATQNPVDHEGTFPLPEAQLDRFLLKLLVDYPSPAMELAILQLNARGDALPTPPVTLSQSDLLEARTAVQGVQMQGRLEHYLVQLVCATRPGSGLCPELDPLVAVGASPRASIGLARAARARAWLAGRDFVLPEDIQQLAPAVLRHRLIPSYQALADNLDSEALITLLLDAIPCP